MYTLDILLGFMCGTKYPPIRPSSFNRENGIVHEKYAHKLIRLKQSEL